MATLNLYYWDACMFYEHCMGDQTDPYRVQAVADLLAENVIALGVNDVARAQTALEGVVGKRLTYRGPSFRGQASA